MISQNIFLTGKEVTFTGVNLNSSHSLKREIEMSNRPCFCTSDWNLIILRCTFKMEMQLSFSKKFL